MAATARDAARPGVLLVMSQREYASNGGVRSAYELLRHLRRVEVHVWTSGESDLTRELRALVASVQVRPALGSGRSLPRRTLNAVAENLAAFRAVRRHRYRVVHVNDRLAFWRTAIGAKLAGAYVVDNLRDTQPRLGRLKALKWAIEFVLADRVVVLSEDMKRRWAQVLPISTEQWQAIYSAVDPRVFRPRTDADRAALRASLGIAPGEQALIYVGAFRDKKRQLPFIEQFVPRLKAALPEARVHFLGDFQPDRDPYARACRSAVERLGLDGAVRFHGHQGRVADWYAAADLTVLASAQEGLARSMIESLACGTPVVSFDVASAAEILVGHDLGWVAAMDDYEALQAAVLQWAGDARGQAERRLRAARVAADLFHPERSAEQYEAVYASA